MISNNNNSNYKFINVDDCEVEDYQEDLLGWIWEDKNYLKNSLKSSSDLDDEIMIIKMLDQRDNHLILIPIVFDSL